MVTAKSNQSALEGIMLTTSLVAQATPQNLVAMRTAPTFLTQVWLHKRVHEVEAAGHQVVIAGGDGFLQLLTYQL